MRQYSVFENKEDWEKFRAGLFTASEVFKLLTEPKNKNEILSKGAKSYVLERVSELLAPAEPNYYNSAMEHGNETEPQAVLRIAKELNKNVNDSDFIYTSLGGFVFFWDDEFDLGGTPDVIIKDKMICEIKCPLSKTHLDYLMIKDEFDLQNKLPQYYAQMQLNMYLTNLKKCLFVSYDDRFYNEKHHYKEIIVNINEDFIDNLKCKAKKAKEFKNEILKTINN